jgi:hypothetical protein
MNLQETSRTEPNESSEKKHNKSMHEKLPLPSLIVSKASDRSINSHKPLSTGPPGRAGSNIGNNENPINLYPEIESAKVAEDIFTLSDIESWEPIITGVMRYFFKKSEWHTEYPQKFKQSFNSLRYGHIDFEKFTVQISDIFRCFATVHWADFFTFLEMEKILLGRNEVYEENFRIFGKDGYMTKLVNDLRKRLNEEISNPITTNVTKAESDCPKVP